MKRIAGKNIYDSNHVTCELVGVNLFKHLLAKRLLEHYFAIFKSRCIVINHLNYYFQLNSEINIDTENLFRNHYGIESLMVNDLDIDR